MSDRIVLRFLISSETDLQQTGAAVTNRMVNVDTWLENDIIHL